MTKKRDQLIEGQYDQITEDCPRMQKRFATEVLRDVGAWLILHWLRHDARADSAALAREGGNVDWADGVKADAAKCCDVIQDMFSRLSDKWSVKDWHKAQTFVDTLLAARGKDGKPLHALAHVLSSPGVSTDGRVAGGSGPDSPVGPRTPDQDGGGHQ